MNREEFDKLYLGKAVHCDTEEKANHFLALADSLGHKWVLGGSLIERSCWETYEKETCYYVIKDRFTYDDIEYFKDKNYQIIEYQLPHKFKVGDKVKVNNTLKVGVIERVDSSSPMPYYVKIDGDNKWLWNLSENELEKVEEPTHKEETIDDIIEEIKEHQKSINVLLNRLERKVKVGK